MVKRLIAKIVMAWHRWRLNQDLKIAIEQAKEIRYKSHKKQFVLYFNGRFNVVEKQKVKELVRTGGFFRKGISVKDVERSAYYVTD
jgi:hypothetical protein